MELLIWEAIDSTAFSGVSFPLIIFSISVSTICLASGDTSNQADHQAAEEKSCPQVHMNCSYIGRELYIEISDSGVGIQDVAKAMEPLYTSKPQLDRSGMGFSFMEAFMDALTVTSEPGHGTTVKMKKVL